MTKTLSLSQPKRHATIITLTLERIAHFDTYTLGRLHLDEGFVWTIEHPYQGLVEPSCLPQGLYTFRNTQSDLRYKAIDDTKAGIRARSFPLNNYPDICLGTDWKHPNRSKAVVSAIGCEKAFMLFDAYCARYEFFAFRLSIITKQARSK